MNPNPFKSLLHSRKFWIVIVDTFTALLALWISTLVPEETANMILMTWAILQAPVVFLIGSIAYEDGQAKRAGNPEPEG